MKTLIITGANGNLGTACVKKFLTEEYKVIAVDGKKTNLGFAAGNPAFEFVTVNLSNEEETTAFIRSCIEKHAKIDGALMLVGGFAAGNIEATIGADLHKMFSMNFETAYYMARPLLQHMLQEHYGRLVFIGARPALQAAQGKEMVAYSLTKSLVFTLADYINETAKGNNVTATVIVPSTIDTPINRAAMPDADPTNWITAEALADTIAFVLSEKGNALREPVLKVYNNA